MKLKQVVGQMRGKLVEPHPRHLRQIANAPQRKQNVLKRIDTQIEPNKPLPPNVVAPQKRQRVAPKQI